MWQTKYAAAIPKNLGVGVNFRPCSEGYFLSGRPQSVVHCQGGYRKDAQTKCNYCFDFKACGNDDWCGGLVFTQFRQSFISTRIPAPNRCQIQHKLKVAEVPVEKKKVCLSDLVNTSPTPPPPLPSLRPVIKIIADGGIHGSHS